MEEGVLTYISLFSSAGVGCYGFKQEGFECIATNELQEKRLKIQKNNSKCRYESGYILGDIKKVEVYNKLIDEVNLWKNKHGIKQIDVIVATPPCQGISLVNHKKTDKEYIRNSLVIESFKIINELKPKVFIIENVRLFLNTICIDKDGKTKKIKEAMEDTLGEFFNISYNIMNFKDFGCPSSRTRTLVIGVDKALQNISPKHLFPERTNEIYLKDSIGDLPPLKSMGEIFSEDIFHSFKKYNQNMVPWIENLREGESAFGNSDVYRIPHTIKNGKIVLNKNNHGDKYRRQCWNKVGPCVHTRNDILSSQNTIHPSDNRVFSIRELMRIMSIPDDFKWVDIPREVLNNLSKNEKEKFLRQYEINIRQSIGEAVPTIVFRKIAQKIKYVINNNK